MSVPAAGRGRLALACLGVLLAAADTYVVVLALPDMMTGVGLDVDQMQRAAPIISDFLLGYIAMLPLIGRLSDLFGRSPVLVGSLLLFAFGSLITAGAHDLGEVVGGRFLQGVGGGGLVPATLALVADLWPPRRRGLPLGVVGAVQELGSVLGPLFGAAILIWADWRAIFWINLACGLLLAAGFVRRRTRVRDVPGLLLLVLALVAFALDLIEPRRLVEDVTLGLAFVPFDWEFVNSRIATPIGVTWLLLLAAFVVRELTASQPLLPLRRIPAVFKSADFAGALLLGLALGGVVVTFAVADPQTEVISPAGPWLLAGSAVCAALFAVRERRAKVSLIPHGALRAKAAWGSLVVSFFIGSALIAALVDVPVFARATIYPDSQLGAAFVLVRFLVALPVGALLGGWLTRRLPAGPITGFAMLLSAGAFVVMAGWDQHALHGWGADVALVVCGLGFGLAIAPVNAALLAATPSDAHGVGSALLVVARMVGMLVGLSALTAVGLRRFFEYNARIPAPEELCPRSPTSCPAYGDAIREAALVQIHTIFAGAAVCAAAAGVIGLIVLGVARAPRTAETHRTPPPGDRASAR